LFEPRKFREIDSGKRQAVSGHIPKNARKQIHMQGGKIRKIQYVMNGIY
jgi:hypothetical protein